MQKLVSFVLAVMLAFGMVGCSGGDGGGANDSPPAESQQTSAPDENSNVPEESQENTPTTLEDEQSTEPFFTASGSGDDVITGLSPEYVSFLKVNHAGSGHFAVKAHYGNGNDYDLLINTAEPYNGGRTLIFANRDYTLEITAKGDWSVDAYSLGTSSTDSFSDSGDVVTQIFIPSSNVYEITAPGGGHFAVKGWSVTKGRYDLLVNTTDDYSGTVMFNHPGELCFFEITGERDFTITPRAQ